MRQSVYCRAEYVVEQLRQYSAESVLILQTTPSSLRGSLPSLLRSSTVRTVLATTAVRLSEYGVHHGVLDRAE